MAKKKKLEENATTTQGYPSFGGVSGDDDGPPGSTHMGHKYNRKMVYNRLTGAYPNFFVDGEKAWKWDVFTNAKGMEDSDNYHSTIDSFNKQNSPIKRKDFDIWTHIKYGKDVDDKWPEWKEKLRTPEQDSQISDNNPDLIENPETGKDDEIINKINKHLKKEK